MAATIHAGRARFRHVSLAVAGQPATLALTAVLAAFAATRLALFWRFPPFFDEALYASWAQIGADDGDARFVALANGKDPLLSWAGMALYHLGLDPLEAVRLVSLLAGTVTLVAVGAIGRELGGRRTGLVAMALYVLVPFSLVHDVVGIAEPLLVATVATALALQLRLARAPALAPALLLGLALGAGLLTKTTGLYAVVLAPAGLLVLAWRAPGLRLRLARWAGCQLVALVLAGIVQSVVHLSKLWSEQGPIRAAILPTHSVGNGLTHVGHWIDLNLVPFGGVVSGYLTWPLTLVLLAGCGLALRRRTGVAVVLLAWAGLPFAASVLIANVAFPRYLLPMLPALLPLVALPLAELPGLVARLPRPAAARPAVAVATIAVALAAWPLVIDARILADPDRAPYPSGDDVQYATGWAAGGAWRAVAAELRRRALERPLVAATLSGASPALALSVHPSDRVTLVRADADSPLAPASDYVVDAGVADPDHLGAGTLRPVWRYSRPRGGTALRLLQRGIEVDGRFYASPAELRAGLGLSDSAFDAFIAGHPVVRDWYVAAAKAAEARGPGG